MLFFSTPILYRKKRNVLTSYNHSWKRYGNQFLFLKRSRQIMGRAALPALMPPSSPVHRGASVGGSPALLKACEQPLITGSELHVPWTCSAEGGTRLLWKIEQSFCSLHPKPSHADNFGTSTSLLSENSAAALRW